MSGTITSINSAEKTSEKKRPVPSATLVLGSGIAGDAHADQPVRQVSLLADESIAKMRAAGFAVGPGDFAENITTHGLPLMDLSLGARIRLGRDAIVQISQIGKECQTPCRIGAEIGDCIMPREGIFAQVACGGEISSGDAAEVTSAKVGAVITASDRCSRGEREDESGPMLVELLESIGLEMANYSVLPDEEDRIAQQLEFLTDRCGVDLVLTTGGTGLAPRDVTPEATARVLTKPVFGIAEAIRATSLKFTPYACLSRGMSGLRGRTLIINLPGSKKAILEIRDFLAKVLPHALESLRGEVKDCGMGGHNSTL